MLTLELGNILRFAYLLIFQTVQKYCSELYKRQVTLSKG